MTLNETHDPTRLRFVKVPGITNVQCQKWYNESDYFPWKVQIRPAELCAGEPDVGGKDACQGDSGGNIQGSKISIIMYSYDIQMIVLC